MLGKNKNINPFGSRTYCMKPFTSAFSDSVNRYRLCADCGITKEIEHMTLENTLPMDYFFSPEMDKVREKMLKGEPVSGCEICYDYEEKSGWSFRQDSFNRMGKYNLDGLEGYPTRPMKPTIKLRMIGTKCNLGCFMCRAYDSSTRRMELSQADLWDKWRALGIKEYEDEKVRPIGNKRYREVLSHLKEKEKLISQYSMYGGEPLILDRVWEMLDQVSDEHAQDLFVWISSNLTQLDFKGRKVEELIEKFPRIELEVSCDHYGEKLRWIRYPIDVERFEGNLRRVKKHIKYIICTVNILNVFDLRQIEDYYEENFGLPVSFNNVLYSPESLSIKNLPNKSEIPYVPVEIEAELAKPAIPSELERGIEYIRSLEAHRGFPYPGMLKW
jgi:hypothetical protein